VRPVSDAGERVALPIADSGLVPASYDLQADVRSRIAAARAELGDRARVVVDQDIFVLVGPGGSAFDGAAHLAHDALGAYFNGRFSTRPARPVVVYLFSSAPSYEAFCQKRFGDKCKEVLGIYQRARREMVVDLSLGASTLTHELVHPIVESDFPTAPSWLDEGLGALYENPVFAGPGEIHGATNWRHARLIEALESPAEREEAIRRELAESKRQIEEHTGQTVTHLCYPWHVSGPTARRLAAQLGYRTAFCGKVRGVPITPVGGDPLTIARIGEDYVELLPGRGREDLFRILRRKWRRRLDRHPA